MRVLTPEKVTEITEKLALASENSTRLYDAGAKSEYDLFWDTFQKNGTRRYYERAFGDTTNNGNMWVYGKTYRPKYPMKPLSADGMYAHAALPYDAIAEVDFSECQNFNNTFSYFNVGGDKKIPPINMSASKSAQNMFGWVSGINEIEKITVSATSVLSAMFNGATSIREVRFEGEIGSSLGISTCKQLSKESIMSIVNHLSDTTTGLKVSFSRDAVDVAFQTPDGWHDGSTSAEWELSVIRYKPNWTFTLA